MRRAFFILFVSSALVFVFAGRSGFGQTAPPRPPSPVVAGVDWHWPTYTHAAEGSDLWPVTWGGDNLLYTAWGDGGGFGGSDTDGRVAMGFARIEGDPPGWHGVNVNGGKNPEHASSFPKKGKTAGLAMVDGALYATENLQNGEWPDVDHVLIWSTNRGATWERVSWVFPKGVGNFMPGVFLQFGPDYGGVPPGLEGYVYVYGPKQPAPGHEGRELFLARAARHRLREPGAWEYFAGTDSAHGARWSGAMAEAGAVFMDTNGACAGGAVYDGGLQRFVLSSYHTGPGQLGIFDSANPWGPWTTIDYEDHFGGMGAEGEGLTCQFPAKWMSADGRTLWCVFSVYGAGAKMGIDGHDRLNVVEARLGTGGRGSREP